MANVPGNLKYTREHEWAKQEGDRVRVGITAYAQEQLGDVVFVELPKIGAKVAAAKNFGVVESVKAVSDLFAPVSGEGSRSTFSQSTSVPCWPRLSAQRIDLQSSTSSTSQSLASTTKSRSHRAHAV